MTPGARIAAAIALLDEIGAGAPAEQALTRWARASRFAGSGDRAAVRDHVFDVLRCWRSDAARGGAETGRARMIGHLRGQGIDPSALFNGVGHAPAPLSAEEAAAGRAPLQGAEASDLPDWLVPVFQHSLGPDWHIAAEALQTRAPVTVRVNLTKCSVDEARERLARDGVTAQPNPRSASALTLTEGARRLRNADSFAAGWVELQDASSQAAVAMIEGGGRVLDYCAGGGGKALALAAQGWQVTAHDADPKRMADLPERARRGGHRIDVVQSAEGLFDAVLCDAPCSGSGTWRRTPDAKWKATPDRLEQLTQVQAEILDHAIAYVAPRGALYYATCSLLKPENHLQVEGFLQRHPGWTCVWDKAWPVNSEGDGFYLARLERLTQA